MSSDVAAEPIALDRVAAYLRRGRDLALSVRSAYVLSALLVAQWAALLAFALTVRHNDWLYYAGGDQLWHYSGAYLLAHGHVPPAFVGYGWSILMLPVAAVAGPDLVSALPPIVIFNTVVLLPLALLCVYGIATRIAGRLFGYWAAALWIVLPYLGIVFLEPGYHQKYTELTLPQLLGLTPGADFPSMVALLVSGYFCLRTLDSDRWHAAAAAGLAAGYSIAIKPSNSIFLFAPALLLLALKRRALVPYALALAPPLLTLALWKYRGLGELASAPAEPVRLAGGTGDLAHRIFSPSLNNWDHLHQVLLALREHFWASRVMEWLPVAGMLALLARSLRGFLLVASWFTAYLLIKGTYISASVDDASFFRILMPAFPAFLILGAAVLLLVPGVRARPEPQPFSLGGRRVAIALVGAIVIFAAVPLGVIAAVPRLHDRGSLAVRVGGSLIPVSAAIVARSKAQGNDVHLSWHARPAGPASGFYRVFRTGNAEGGVFCAGRLSDAADNCELSMDSPGVTRAPAFVDHPGRGTWTYRIGIAANWLNDERYGDVYVVSPPVTATVR